ncbi:hypothetical protein AB0P41_01255 [Streptomyces sp. NPDC079167]|uniref:hypothetical protein n=1 Tax=Streptomyces sp. NPDC079167 TaxID=3154513 RepID=UPI00342DE27D
MEPVVTVAVVAGSASIAGAAIAASFQYASKAREEKRLARLAQIEADTRIADAFATLMGKAHGRGQTHLSEAALPILFEGELLDETRNALTRIVTGQSEHRAEARADRALDVATLRTVGVGKADMDAAIQVIAQLGLKHSLLTRPAWVGLEGRNEFQPVHECSELVTRLKQFESEEIMRLRRSRWSRLLSWLRGR